MSAEPTMQDDPADQFSDEELGLADADDLIAAAQAEADEMVLDLSEAMLPIPEGDYTFLLVDIGKSATKDHRPMLAITAKVLDVGPMMDRTVQRNFMLVGKGAGFTLPLLEALGETVDYATGKVSLSLGRLQAQRGVAVFKAHATVKDGWNDLSKFEAASLPG